MSIPVQTETDAANLALGSIGEPPIASLNDGSSRALACNLHFAPLRDAMQRDHDWNFCSAWFLPARATQAAIGVLINRFPMPDDCLKVRDVQPQRSTIAGNQGISITDPAIIAELEASQPPLPTDEAQWNIEAVTVNPSDVPGCTMVVVTAMTAPLINYSRRIIFPRLWDALFVEAFAEALAGKVAPQIAKDISAGDKKTASARAMVDDASRTDSREQSPRHISRDTSWVRSRRISSPFGWRNR